MKSIFLNPGSDILSVSVHLDRMLSTAPFMSNIGRLSRQGQSNCYSPGGKVMFVKATPKLNTICQAMSKANLALMMSQPAHYDVI